MALGHSPQIVTNGLILCLDGGNRKSFAGLGVERVGGILPTFGNWGGLTGSSTSYTSSYGNAVYLNTIIGGGVNWWYSVNGGQACSSSTQYVITARVKYTGSSTTPHPNLFYVRQYNSSGTQTSESGKFSTTNMIPLTDGWYLAWAYFTTDATATSFYVHGYEYNANMNIWLEDIQCKLAGLSDISGNGYNASLTGTPAINTGYMQFNTSTYAQSMVNLSSGTSTIMVASRYISGTNGRTIGGVNNNYLLGHHGGLQNRFYSEGWVDYGDTSDSTWKIYAGTSDTITDLYNLYTNGVLRSSNNGGSQGANGIQLNGYGGTYERSDCQIGIVLAYNRVLSAAEVNQNFNALRGRYGI